MKKVLIITYYWPPAGGPGVQRILKFAKYLPLYGWQPLILTVKNGVYPALDNSLKNDIHPDLKVYHSTNPEPDFFYRKFISRSLSGPTSIGVLANKPLSWTQRFAKYVRLNFFIPDAKKYWRSFAVKEGMKIIRDEKPDLIFSSSPPPTTHLIAMDLADWSKLNWVADFRDPWSKIHYYDQVRSKRAILKDEALEKKVLEKCTQVVCVSKKFAKLLICDDFSKIKLIPNGFDAEDFLSTYKKTDKFIISYIGGLNTNRYYKSIFESLHLLIQDSKIPAEKVELQFAGQIDTNIKANLETLFIGLDVVKILGYLSHHAAIRTMIQSDLLLLFTEKVSNYQGHLPGKLFEYLASGTEILGIGDPNGEAAEILQNTSRGNIVSSYTDVSGLILNAYRNWEKSKRIESDNLKIDQYSRQNLTAELAFLFDKV